VQADPQRRASFVVHSAIASFYHKSFPALGSASQGVRLIGRVLVNMSIPEVLTIIKDSLVSIAAIVTAVVAIKGLHSWKKEIKGKAEFETARLLLKSIYKTRDNIKACRSPFISGHEYPEWYKGPIGNHLPKEEKDARIYLYKNRFNPIIASVQELDLAVLESEALWGNAVKLKTDKLKACISELKFEIDYEIDNFVSESDINKDDLKSHRHILFSLPDSSFSEKIDAAITSIEKVILPYLKR